MVSLGALQARLPARHRREQLADVAIAAATFAGSIAVMRHGGVFVSRAGSGDLDITAVTLVGLTTLPLLAWRRAPFGIFVATATANVLLAAVVYPIGMPIGPAAALYLFAAHRDRTHPTTRRIVTSVAALLLAYGAASILADATFPGFELAHAGLLWAVAWFAGERTRLRREQIIELKLDAQRARQLAAAEERARIARDLHDSAGHAINVIAVRAGAARLRYRQDPDRSLLALAEIEELARRTVEEIDHLVGALRDRTTATAANAPPGLASLDTLVAEHAGAGLDVVRVTNGTPPKPLDTAVDQAAFRILQEALTNASRHGAGTARVDVAFVENGIELRVTNSVAPSRPPRHDGGGAGLVGMRERASLLGGTLDVAETNGTFRVSARLPYAVGKT